MMSKLTAVNLIPGKTYRVIWPFDDYDGVTHPPGETWRFIEKNFSPYEDGLTLRIQINGVEKWLRLQWLPEAQGQIIDNFGDYVEEVQG